MIKLALLSVSDKTGIIPFAQTLVADFGVQILSTGGTKKALEEAGIPVTAVEDYTGFPEMMEGRVKTLHPKIHGGLLAVRDNIEHQTKAKEHDISMIDLVCVNLYPFESVSQKEGVEESELIENIDIGGPSMLRSAAKNFQSVTVLTDPADYERVVAEMKVNAGETTLELRRELACKVYFKTAQYDSCIANVLTHGERRAIFMEDQTVLRYGENPHHQGYFYHLSNTVPESDISNARIVQGKEMSFLNYFDSHAALEMVRMFPEPTATFVKHANPCGMASHADLKTAFINAYECDPRSAFGVIIAMNRECTEEVVDVMLERKMFVEILIAPSFSAAALEKLAKKPNIRVLETGELKPLTCNYDIKKIGNGLLYQTTDPSLLTEADLQFVTDKKPNAAQIRDLLFAWGVVKHVKSNAIVLVKDQTTVGIGAGQMSRVDSTEIAVRKGGSGCAAQCWPVMPSSRFRTRSKSQPQTVSRRSFSRGGR